MEGWLGNPAHAGFRRVGDRAVVCLVIGHRVLGQIKCETSEPEANGNIWQLLSGLAHEKSRCRREQADTRPLTRL